MTRRLRGVVFAATLLSAAASAQETAPTSRAASGPAASRPVVGPENAAAALLGDRPTVRKQAAAWINEHPDVGVPALVAALGSDAALRAPFDGIRATGMVKDRRVSAALLLLLDRPGFRWRPQVLDALADHAALDARPRFVAEVNSSVWRSRAACCRGIAALKDRELLPLLDLLCDDEEAPVRLEAAKARWSFGDPGGLGYVVRDLSLDRRFFEFDHGASARDAAAAFLNEICGPKTFPVPQPPLDLAGLIKALATVRAALGARAGDLPDVVAPHDPDVVGLKYAVEVRNCAVGDLMFRFDLEGEVVFGRDRLERRKVPAALVKDLAERLTAFDYGPRKKLHLGPITCDFERIGVFVDGAWSSATIGDGRRPASLDPFEAGVLKLLEAAWGRPSVAPHVERVRPFAERK